MFALYIFSKMRGKEKLYNLAGQFKTKEEAVKALASTGKDGKILTLEQARKMSNKATPAQAPVRRNNFGNFGYKSVGRL